MQAPPTFDNTLIAQDCSALNCADGVQSVHEKQEVLSINVETVQWTLS